MKTNEQLNADTLFAFQMALKGHKQFEYQHPNGRWYRVNVVDSITPHRIYHDIPEGWTRHDGEDWKGDKDAVIEEVMYCSGAVSAHKNIRANDWNTRFNYADPAFRIYAYKLAKQTPAIPKGFTSNNNAGDNSYCPLAEDMIVEYIGKDGKQGKDKARNLYWFNVIAYRVLEKKVIPWTLESVPVGISVVSKDGSCKNVIVMAGKDIVILGGNGFSKSYETLADDYLQLDGSICGKEVEQ